MSHGGVRIAAQGKINLALRVLAREASGYHQLETIFARIALADTVTIRTGDHRRTVAVHGADVGPPERNLAWRAGVAYAARAGWPTGFHIEVEKRIPVGGGLGGGSADAAAVLRGLNAIAPEPLPDAELLEIGFTLGADVPFLTSELPAALAWGRGERMLGLPQLEATPVALIIPPFGISTTDAFGWLSAARDAGRVRPAPAAVLDVSGANWRALEQLGVNDLEDPVRSTHRALGDALDALRRVHGDRAALMTGSGSTLFVIGEQEVSAPSGWRVLRTRACVPAEAPQRL